MQKLMILAGFVGLAGCATTTLTPVPPMLADVHWSQAEVIEDPVDGSIPAFPFEAHRLRRPSEKVVSYELGQEVSVDVMVGKPLRLELEVGENIHNIVDGFRGAMAEGDQTPPWDVVESTSGEVPQPHILITATKAGLLNGLSITTSKRVYDVACRSVVSSRVRVVRWEYPPAVVPVKRPPRILPDTTSAQAYHVGYTVQASSPQPVWTPVRPVVDNGRQTFIQLPPNLSAMQAPMIRLLGANGPELVNARLYRSVLILDHLFDAAELRYGAGEHAETVRIVRGASQTITCPGDASCPVWSERVAGR